jgi:hypothetical protein
VKFIKAEKETFCFQIDSREKRLLFQVLERYPLVPVSHHQICKGEERREDQALLEEAVVAQRKAHKRQVQALMRSKSRFREHKHGYQFSLKAPQMEWLLQVLNDVRVGSWLAIGSPDGPVETYAALNEKTAPYFWAMEVAGHFQMILLAAMNGAGQP